MAYKMYPFAYKSKAYPQTPTSVFAINTEEWVVGISVRKFFNLITYTNELHIKFLCFTLLFRKFKEDERVKNNE